MLEINVHQCQNVMNRISMCNNKQMECLRFIDALNPVAHKIVGLLFNVADLELVRCWQVGHCLKKNIYIYMYITEGKI